MNNYLKSQICVLPVRRLNDFAYDHNYNDNVILVLIADPVESAEVKTCATRNLRANLRRIRMEHQVQYYVFLSARDRFNRKPLVKEIKGFLNQHEIEITLLLPYLTPPTDDFRIDGIVQSFIISEKAFDSKVFSLTNNGRFIYNLVNFHLNSLDGKNVEIVQVGKPTSPSKMSKNQVSEKLNVSSLQIVHKGSLKLLNRCLARLNNAKSIPGKVEICFDDNSYKMLDINQFKNIADKTTIYKNSPLGVGPYLARQHMVEQSDNEHIYLLDSDDISGPSRFDKLTPEFQKRKLDVLGSHELRVDQMSKQLVIVRFPLDVNYALAKQSFHPMLHGTWIITRTGFLKAGGYSTAGKFGYDTQFLFRASFFLKIGNMDDFLYFRFKRPNSLTTAKKTNLGSTLRKFMAWRLRVDFELVFAGKLNLLDSSLRKREHNFPFKITKVATESALDKGAQHSHRMIQVNNNSTTTRKLSDQNPSLTTEVTNKRKSSLNIEKEIYGFLSKTIYNELVEYGVDDEYIFTFSLYLHWVAVNEYAKTTSETDICSTETLLKKLQTDVTDNYSQLFASFIDTLFTNDSEVLVSIYNDVYTANTSLKWLQEWRSLCNFCFATNKFKIQICLTLLSIVNECLKIRANRTTISLNVLLQIQKKHIDIERLA